MGMDVMGNNPISDRGDYFRNNVWWWRPLADYCLDNHGDIAEKCEYWHSNDGDGLDAYDSERLAQRLFADIESGKVDEYERRYNEERAALPRRECIWCDSTGIRTDGIGQEQGMPTRELSPEVQILTGRTHGWCNGCDGIGTQESLAMSYPFSKENVQEFAHFLAECGGFSIC
jgi:hypothetical protein